MEEERDINEEDKQERGISLDANVKKELKEKKKQEKEKQYTIKVNEKKNIISFKSKAGKYKISFLQRNIILSLLGMPVNLTEVNEMIDQPQPVMDKNFSKLQDMGLVENIAKMQKKKIRGDSHIQVYWMLSEPVGNEVALALLDFFNEEEKNKLKAELEKS